MKTGLVLCLISVFLFPTLFGPRSTQAQDSAFQPGDWLLTTQDLLVYAQADESSTNVTMLPTGLKVRLFRDAVSGENGQWFYIHDNAFGWVFQPAAATVFMPYTEDAAGKLLDQYTNRIENANNDYEAYRLRALMYYNMKEYLLAVDDMQTYFDSLNYSDESGYWSSWIAEFYVKTSDPELLIEATIASSMAGMGMSQDLMIGMRDAQIEDKYGFVTTTEDFYREAIQQAPDWAILYNNWGERLMDSDDRRAEELLEQAIDIDPQLSEAYTNLGRIYRVRAEYETAIDYHTLAIEANPFDGEAYMYRAGTYRHMSQITNAVDDYLNAIELEPENSLIRTDFGSYHQGSGNFRLALEQYDIAIELAPDNAIAYMGKSMSHSYLGEFEEAAETLEIGVDLLGARSNLLYNFRGGEIYIELERYEDAETQLDIFVNSWRNPSDTAWWVVASVMLGYVQVELGKFDAALTTYQNAFDINANVAQNYMSWVHSYRPIIHVTDEDVRRAQRAVDNDPNNASLYFELGKEQLELGLWTDAIANFRAYNLMTDDAPEGFIDFVNGLDDLVSQR